MATKKDTTKKEPAKKRTPRKTYPDVVYILAADMVRTDELRYSLRSLKNLKHGKVWFVCGFPEGFKPDKVLEHEQTGPSRWAKVRSSIVEVCKCSKISKDFYLFNDDFFIMKPCEEIPPLHRGTIAEHARQIYSMHGFHSRYEENMRASEEALLGAGLTVFDYSLHIPLMVNRAKALEVLEKFPDLSAFRNLYGNYAGIGGEYMHDVKITSPADVLPEDWTLCSTGDNAFATGEVGKAIRRAFPEPCKYEEVAKK